MIVVLLVLIFAAILFPRLMRFLIGLIILGTLYFVGVAAKADGPQDPYAGEYKKRLFAEENAERENYFTFSKVFFFAAGCNVVSVGAAHAVVGTMAEGYILSFPYKYRDQFMTRDFLSRNQSAEREGLDKAKEPDACEYWKQNPDMVYKVRSLASPYR